MDYWRQRNPYKQNIQQEQDEQNVPNFDYNYPYNMYNPYLWNPFFNPGYPNAWYPNAQGVPYQPNLNPSNPTTAYPIYQDNINPSFDPNQGYPVNENIGNSWEQPYPDNSAPNQVGNWDPYYESNPQIGNLNEFMQSQNQSPQNWNPVVAYQDSQQSNSNIPSQITNSPNQNFEPQNNLPIESNAPNELQYPVDNLFQSPQEELLLQPSQQQSVAEQVPIVEENKPTSDQEFNIPVEEPANPVIPIESPIDIPSNIQQEQDIIPLNQELETTPLESTAIESIIPDEQK